MAYGKNASSWDALKQFFWSDYILCNSLSNIEVGVLCTYIIIGSENGNSRNVGFEMTIIVGIHSRRLTYCGHVIIMCNNKLPLITLFCSTNGTQYQRFVLGIYIISKAIERYYAPLALCLNSHALSVSLTPGHYFSRFHAKYVKSPAWMRNIPPRM